MSRATLPDDERESAAVGPARGRPRDAATDERILATTFRQLVELGYAGLSIESVATESGVAKTTIYRRYPAKRDLVVAALRRSAPFEGPPIDLPAREALDRFVRIAIHTLIDSGAVRVLGSLLAEEQREPGILEVFREQLLRPRRALVEAMLRRGVDRGEIRPDIDPLIVTEMVAGAVFGHHMILGFHADEAWIDGLVEHVWAAIRAEDGST
jgi:AcrR family transcriptional regulator